MVPVEEYEWRFNLIYQQGSPGDWWEQTAWRGLIAENVVQAIAYDLIAVKMLRMDAASIELIGTVHDEAIARAVEFQAEVILHRFFASLSPVPFSADLPAPGSRPADPLRRQRTDGVAGQIHCVV
jgi:hypothetical protein